MIFFSKMSDEKLSSIDDDRTDENFLIGIINLLDVSDRSDALSVYNKTLVSL